MARATNKGRNGGKTKAWRDVKVQQSAYQFVTRFLYQFGSEATLERVHETAIKVAAGRAIKARGNAIRRPGKAVRFIAVGA